uniref:Multidrug resistance-associated protein 5 n=1 Tax=Tanacetum cinerariifolium TaxID=118510 RepID=A0A699HL83_TANCI|nr:multidrug resistance-associated protein 5 [Tanacetum cinerariifolium]
MDITEVTLIEEQMSPWKVGRYGNNHIFPVAQAKVIVENKYKWRWFLDLLGDDLDIQNGHGLTLMSDQHKGLIDAVKEVMPLAEHRQCAHHIYEVFQKYYKGVEFREVRMNTMRHIMDKRTSDICPSIQKILEQTKDQKRFWHVVPSGGNKFEIRRGSDAFKVDEKEKNCSYRMWQLSGRPKKKVPIDTTSLVNEDDIPRFVNIEIDESDKAASSNNLVFNNGRRIELGMN